MMTGSKSQLGAQALRSQLNMVLSDHNLCTLNLDKTVPFSAAQAASPAGFPLKIALVEGTVLDGSTPMVLPNYSVKVNSLVFQSNGPPTLNGVADADTMSNNTVYSGDVYLNVEKSTASTLTGQGATGSDFAGGIRIELPIGHDAHADRHIRNRQDFPKLLPIRILAWVIGGSKNPNNQPTCNRLRVHGIDLGRQPSLERRRRQPHLHPTVRVRPIRGLRRKRRSHLQNPLGDLNRIGKDQLMEIPGLDSDRG